MKALKQKLYKTLILLIPIGTMVKKNTNEHDYYKPLNAFLTYHFGKTPGNETKLANVLHYCKTNWAQISEHELDNGDLDLNVQTLLEIQPMDIAR